MSKCNIRPVCCRLVSRPVRWEGQAYLIALDVGWFCAAIKCACARVTELSWRNCIQWMPNMRSLPLF